MPQWSKQHEHFSQRVSSLLDWLWLCLIKLHCLRFSKYHQWNFHWLLKTHLPRLRNHQTLLSSVNWRDYPPLPRFLPVATSGSIKIYECGESVLGYLELKESLAECKLNFWNIGAWIKENVAFPFLL